MIRQVVVFVCALCVSFALAVSAQADPPAPSGVATPDPSNSEAAKKGGAPQAGAAPAPDPCADKQGDKRLVCLIEQTTARQKEQIDAMMAESEQHKRDEAGRLRLMLYGIEPGIGMSVHFPLAFLEERRQSQAVVSATTYASLHPWFWRSDVPHLTKVYCAQSWVGVDFASVQSNVEALAALDASARVAVLHTSRALNDALKTCLSDDPQPPSAPCDALYQQVEGLFPPGASTDHAELRSAHGTCKGDTTSYATCMETTLQAKIKQLLWQTGGAGRCAQGTLGFYLGVTLPYQAQISGPLGSFDRAISTGFSTGFSFSPSAYLSLLLGITYNTYEENLVVDAPSKQRHNQLTGTVAIGGNLDIITKLLGK